MKILYVINTGLLGGLQRHVRTLMRALAGVAETAVVVNTILDDQVIPMFEGSGMKVYRLDGTSGHDFRVIGRFRKVLEDFKPDVIHAHGLPFVVACALLMKKWLGWFRTPVLHSLHCPTEKPTMKGLLENFILDRLVDYWLPVSSPTWERFKHWHPKAQGEVFFNPVMVSDFDREDHFSRGEREERGEFIVGMVGRNADQKDWPSFHRVEALVKEKLSTSNLHLPPTPIKFLNAGEEALCDGRSAIRQMDLFVMTSKHEQLPTTVLECFALGTPICGFLPDGGTSDILQFSKGPVREGFIKERSCEKLATLVFDLMMYPGKRQALVEDGRQILEGHFDAVKNCRGQLMEIYRKMVDK